MEHNCIFCEICLDKNKLKYEDDSYVAFDDHKPASKFHLLILPKIHYKNILSLEDHQTQIITDMVEIGKNLLKGAGISEDGCRMGFHWPPFHAISHLHLHVIAPENEMGFIARVIFKKDSYWFVSPNTALERLHNRKRS